MEPMIALLRAVNVGGRNAVSMTDLRAMAAELGLEDARTLLQSGNLVFRATRRAPEELERMLEREAVTRLGLTTEFLVRTRSEWAGIIARNPFSEAARTDPGHLVVMVCREACDPGRLADLQSGHPGPERMQADGRQIYISYPEGIGRSRLTGALIERRLAVRGTGRNWNTVLRLEEMAAG